MKNRFDDWSFLKQFTHARVSIGRAGVSVPTREWLDFKSAHSRARESVWKEVDFS
ncbi:MAG: ethanolamine ammonia-lyase, partial [Proteobacteria bacterium]|nr:ethanolamine ammonia-lyase [Pseudomonadota bacterium]